MTKLPNLKGACPQGFGTSGIKNILTLNSMKKLIIILSTFLVNCQNEPIILIDNSMENIKVKRTYKQLENGEKELLEEVFFDDFENVIKEINYKKEYDDDNSKPTISEYIYDKKGEKILEKKHYQLEESPYYHVKYTYQYNDKKQLVEIAEQDLTEVEKDIQYDYFTYNDSGLKDTARSASFSNGELFTFSSFSTFEYDENKQLIRKTFHTDDSFKKHYTYDKKGNLTKYEFKGYFLCGDDIAKKTYQYNKNNQLILEEVWNAMGENWAYESVYRNGLLFSKTYLYRFPIPKEPVIYDEEDLNNPSMIPPPPPPPNYTRTDLEKDYTKIDVTYYYYNVKQQIVKSIHKVLNEKGTNDETYLFKYE